MDIGSSWVETSGTCAGASSDTRGGVWRGSEVDVGEGVRSLGWESVSAHLVSTSTRSTAGSGEEVWGSSASEGGSREGGDVGSVELDGISVEGRGESWTEASVEGGTYEGWVWICSDGGVKSCAVGRCNLDLDTSSNRLFFATGDDVNKIELFLGEKVGVGDLRAIAEDSLSLAGDMHGGEVGVILEVGGCVCSG